MLNRSDRPSPMAGEAELKYWSVDLQEPYVSPEAVLQRHVPSVKRRTSEDRGR